MSSNAPLVESTPRARVSQVAKVLGIEPAQLVRKLALDDEQPISVHAWLDGPQVLALLKDVAPNASIANAEQLVIQAFAAARTSKPDWKTMTLAVLKNRLIAVSGGAFDEADYGAPRMVHFANLLPSLIAVGDNETLVTLVDESKIPDVEVTKPRHIVAAQSKTRVRADLWNAVMDFKSGRTYVWRTLEGVAEPSTDDNDPNLVLPTITGEIADNWRGELLSAVRSKGLAPEVVTQTELWAGSRAGSQLLPIQVRGMWNVLQNDHATARLRKFFEDNSLELPEDLAVSRVRTAQAPAGDSLRSFLRRCIDVMTTTELEELRISAAVALRASTQNG
jgi:hypothetical protein